MLFGKRACRESEDFVVRIFFGGEEDYIDVSEQLKEKEATKFLEELKQKLLDKSPIIEIEKDRGTSYSKKRYIFLKENIRFIVVREDC